MHYALTPDPLVDGSLGHPVYIFRAHSLTSIDSRTKCVEAVGQHRKAILTFKKILVTAPVNYDN